MDVHDAEALSGWRWLLGVAAAAVIGFAAVSMLTQPHMDAGLPMRVAIAGTCVAVITGTYRSAFVAANIRAFGMVVAVWCYVYFGLRATEASMAWSHTVPLLLIGALTVMLFRRVAEMAVFVGALAAISVWLYTRVDSAQVPLTAYVPSLVTLMVAMSVFTLSKVRLEEALRAAHDELEARVRARTAELRVEVAERRAAEADALRASRAKSVFLTNMSHELRTPLNAILGYTELVQEELADSERDDLVADLERVRASATHLLGMVSDVLDLSRIEAGHLEVERVDVPLAAVVYELSRLIEPERLRAGIALRIDVPEGLQVFTDRTRLAQILLNLIANAVKFTPQGSVRVTARASGDRAVIDVIDTGIGIREEALDRIFDRFVQADDAPTRRRDGSGIGLALSRDLAQRLGGTLTVRSRLGEGSTFSLRLPLGRGDTSEVSATPIH